MSESTLIVGVDVGGTYTDSVCLQDGKVLQVAKEPTTRDVMSGVKNSLSSLLRILRENGNPTNFRQVNIGTTHFVNAIIQRCHLVPVSILRLCGTASTALEPGVDFPQDLKKVVYHSHYFLNGGFNFDGQVITPLDRDEVLNAIIELKEKDVRNIVVSCVFAPVNGEQEIMVGDLIKEHYPGASVTLSHEVGQMGILERENAAILNECLKPLCRTTIGAFRRALAELDITCPFFMTQNDGTIVSSDQALLYPVRTFSSGPTNSMRGAAFLSDLSDNAVVIDIGGTSSDVGYLMQGFPRESSSKGSIAGVATNFRMPDVKSIGLGGGSRVKGDSQNVSVGPTSVGYRLLSESLLFGGNTLTATDIAVAAGLADIEGDVKRVGEIPESLVSSAIEEIHLMLEEVIDQMKVSSEDIPVIVVGGGSILIDEKRGLRGASQLIKPPHYQSANAVGASLSKVGGIVDYVANVAEVSREAAIREAEEKARQAAVKNGAEESTVEIIERHQVALVYMPGTVIRIKAKAVGDMARTQLTREPSGVQHKVDNLTGTGSDGQDGKNGALPASPGSAEDEGEGVEFGRIDNTDDSPHIDMESGEWIVSERDLEYMSIGAGLLGSGGGGSPYVGKLRAQKQLRNGKKIRIIAPERLGTTPDLEGHAVPFAFMGAPVVIGEKLMNGREVSRAIGCLQNMLQADPEELKKQAVKQDPTNEAQRGLVFIEDYNLCPAVRQSNRIVAVVACEIGGCNAMEPLVEGAELGLPILDCDGMGRAFPELQMVSTAIFGKPLYPCVLVSDGSQQAVIVEAKDNLQVEMCFRTVVGGSMGCSSALIISPLTREDVLSKTIPYSYSRIWHLGRLVARSAQREGVKPIDAIIEDGNGQLLITGKITDVVRETTGGFDRGSVEVTGTGDHAGLTLVVSFQNENLIVKKLNGHEDEIVAMTPDLIIIADVDKGHPIPTEEVQYGLRVAVITLPSPAMLQSEQALKFVGPRAFHYDCDYVPIKKGVISPPIPPLP